MILIGDANRKSSILSFKINYQFQLLLQSRLLIRRITKYVSHTSLVRYRERDEFADNENERHSSLIVFVLLLIIYYIFRRNTRGCDLKAKTVR